MATNLTNFSDFTISTTTNTDDTATRDASGSYDSSWAYHNATATTEEAIKYLINGSLVHTSTNITSGSFYPTIQTDRNSDGVSWQLLEFTAEKITWKLVASPGNTYSSAPGMNSNTTRPAWLAQSAGLFIGSGTPNTVQITEYTGSTQYVYTRSPAANFNIGDTFTIQFGGSTTTSTFMPPPPAMVRL